MDTDRLSLTAPDFNDAIDPLPLLVAPGMRVLDALGLMSQVRGQS